MSDPALCGACANVLVTLCPCCDLGDAAEPTTSRRRSDTAIHASDPRPGSGSEPPPLPGRPTGFAAALLEINHKNFGPTDALDLTDEVLEDSEDLAQDQIDVLFRQ